MCWFATALHADIAARNCTRAQAIKVLDMHKPGRKQWDAHWGTEPLKSNGATVDHIIPEDEGGYDTLDNLVACCVICNSSKGKGQGRSCCNLRINPGIAEAAYF